MYQITMEIIEETSTHVMRFKSGLINDGDLAWEIFEKVRDTINALNMDYVYVNLFKGSQLITWYRR